MVEKLSHIIDWWHCSTLMKDYTWKISRQYFNCLPKPSVSLSATEILFLPIKLKILLQGFLRFIKTDNTVKIERLHYAKICQARLSRALINICPRQSENLKLQGLLRIFLLFFLFRSCPQSYSQKVDVLIFRKKHPRWISVLVPEHRPSYLNCPDVF